MSLAYASSILGRKFGVYQKPVSSGPTYDPDATAYFANVASAGGTITTANKTAFNTAFLSMKSTLLYDGSSLWSKIGQGYFFVGQEESSLTGLMVPFVSNYYAGNAVNNNFTSYTKTGGLVGDGVSTYINTGINNNINATWPTNDRFGYVNIVTDPNYDFTGTISLFGYPSTNVRKFEAQAAYAGRQLTYRAYNDSATSPTPTSISLSVGSTGYGIVSTQANGGAHNMYIAGQLYAAPNGIPTTSSLLSSNILLGVRSSGIGTGLYYGTTPIGFAAFGYGIAGMGNGFDPQAFQALDSIVATLISSLT
jgi:hypothetical protein